MKRGGEGNTEEAGKVDSVGGAMSMEAAALGAAGIDEEEEATGTWSKEEGNGKGNEVRGSGSAKGKTEDEEGEDDEQLWPESGPTPLQQGDSMPGNCSSSKALP